MKKKENLKPNEESVIYFDEKMFNRSVAEMNSLANQAEYPANIWKKMKDTTKLLPELDAELFQSWIKDTMLMEVMFNEKADESLNKVFPGAAAMWKRDQRPYDLNQFLDDPGRLLRTLQGLKPNIPLGGFASVKWISFKDGMSYLDDKHRELIKQKCTIPGTPENLKLKSELEGFSGSYNQFLATIEAKFGRKIILRDFRGIKVDENGHLGPDFANLLKMITKSTDPDYIEGVSAPGRSIPKPEVKKQVKVPESFKMNTDE
jgi:hypothetical protein